mmetsp:Transcript_50822/g.56779  ORF Transcript_50822/g.56779 Transcript_50822/m.56779 type:complete len:191 (+) Transcript_50822:287-859(+)
MVGSVIFTNPVKRFASKKESIPCLLMRCIQWGTTTNNDDEDEDEDEDTVRNDERTVRVVVDTANLASVVSSPSLPSPSLPPPSSFASSSIHGVVVVQDEDDEDGSVATDDTPATNCCKDPTIVILCAKDQRQKDKFVERREIRKWNRYSIPKWTIHKTTATLPNENEDEEDADTAVLFFLFFVVSSVKMQ